MWLANKFLTSFKNDISDKTNGWTRDDAQISINEQQLRQPYLIKMDFDPNKNTIILLPFLAGPADYLNRCDQLAQGYNILTIHLHLITQLSTKHLMI